MTDIALDWDALFWKQTPSPLCQRLRLILAHSPDKIDSKSLATYLYCRNNAIQRIEGIVTWRRKGYIDEGGSPYTIRNFLTVACRIVAAAEDNLLSPGVVEDITRPLGDIMGLSAEYIALCMKTASDQIRQDMNHPLRSHHKYQYPDDWYTNQWYCYVRKLMGVYNVERPLIEGTPLWDYVQAEARIKENIKRFLEAKKG